ncbi:hypothetical protein SBA3_2410003 [Candidatus Sulfopaludibacter sp. SbA3]|nr:hypothetical protein SBA3_2410003 [Candidatus Sulfopaludibacter sp. SbA3]
MLFWTGPGEHRALRLPALSRESAATAPLSHLMLHCQPCAPYSCCSPASSPPGSPQSLR